MKAQEQFRDRVIVLTERELETPFLHEEAKKLFQIEGCGTNWEIMVLNTKAIFHKKTIELSALPKQLYSNQLDG